ncbi:hypothetical protein [Massilia phyllosphaerae]|uniref:hypothetical protein n=1 Tax=Massilia phyllosphaerae TaxID=3106034 RepID=UPI002B1CDE60|nr:hypothetical protein [Massilia sp. SGZ-792]
MNAGSRLHQRFLLWTSTAILSGAWLWSSAAHARETLAQRSERQEIEAMERMLGDGLCASAVGAIKSGLAAKKPYIMLMAGSMYEEGLCVKPDWDKAAGLYMRAQEAGQRHAIQRLAAGYARPGRDNGMAIWWAARNGDQITYPSRCIPAADPVNDQDGFNRALETMPPATFQSCVYFIGVVNELLSQIRYPRLASHNNVSGSFIMDFVPANGTIIWAVDKLDVDENSPGAFFRNLATEGLDNPREIKNSLINYLKGKGNFALARYPRPAGDFAPDYVFRGRYVFSIEKW